MPGYDSWKRPPAHPLLALYAAGILDRLITQMYFPGERLNRRDFMFNALPDDRARRALTGKASRGARRRDDVHLRHGVAWLPGDAVLRSLIRLRREPKREPAPMSDAPPTSPLAGIFSEAGRLERYLAFEAALAEVEAELGLIPEEAAREIARIATSETIDTEKLDADTRRTGYPIAPLARQLAAACRDGLGQFVHWGSTTQDVMDTALAMQFRDAFAHIEEDLKGLARDLAGLAARHRDTPMVARTFGGHALPFTFGAKVARWLAPVCRTSSAWKSFARASSSAQFGGAVGTLASFGGRGAEVRERLLARLGLGEPVAVWHAARDTVAETACFLGLVTATLGKIGHDVAALGASDVGEAFEPVSGERDASSTLPQKRNPVYSGGSSPTRESSRATCPSCSTPPGTTTSGDLRGSSRT